MDDIEKDILLRQAQILYPDCESWIMDLAMEAYFNSLKTPVVEEEPMIEIN
jgi:hypothetical protein